MKRTLNLVSGSFAIAGITIVAVLSTVDLGEPERPDLADGAALAAFIFGSLGLLVALQWWSRFGDTPRTPASLQIGFVVRVALAELGLLLGILALIMTGSITPSLIGLGLFLVALLLLTLGLRRVSEP